MKQASTSGPCRTRHSRSRMTSPRAGRCRSRCRHYSSPAPSPVEKGKFVVIRADGFARTLGPPLDDGGLEGVNVSMKFNVNESDNFPFRPPNLSNCKKMSPPLKNICRFGRLKVKMSKLLSQCQSSSYLI